jgi:signal recognition particle subunit SRP54
MKKLGPMENLLEMLPGVSDIPAGAREDMMGQSAEGIKKAEAILSSMTPAERRRPELLNASRRRRVARGSGTEVRDVNELLRNFRQARKMTRRFRKMQKRLPRLGR